MSSRFVFMLILALVSAYSVVQGPAYVSGQGSATVATQYVYGPSAFTLPSYLQEGVTCAQASVIVKFNGTRGQQFHVEFAATSLAILDLYITTPPAIGGGVDFCGDTGAPATWLYTLSNRTGSVDWVAPSTGQFIVFLINSSPDTVSGILSIATYPGSTNSSTS